MNEIKYIEDDLKTIQYHLEEVQKQAARLIGDALYNHHEELKKDAEKEKQEMSRTAAKLFNQISSIIENELDDLQREYIYATKEPNDGYENDTDND